MHRLAHGGGGLPATPQSPVARLLARPVQPWPLQQIHRRPLAQRGPRFVPV